MNLIIPPTCDLTVPLLGAYQMAGYAESIGMPFVVSDFNIAFCRMIVDYSVKRSKTYADIKYIYDEQIDECAISAFMSQFNNIVNYETLLSNFRKCTNTRDYWELVDYLRACFDMYSLQFDGIRFRLDGFDCKYKWNVWSDINLFMKKYSNSIISDAIKQICYKTEISFDNVVGISITFESQLFFAFLICEVIREIHPDAKIIIGGGFINTFVDCAEAMGPIAKYCDYVFAGEGEALIEFIKNGVCSLSASGTKDYSSGARFIVPSDVCDKKLYVEPPHFTQERLFEQFSPKRIVPLRFSYECYWGKCKFCSDKESHECLNSAYNIQCMIDYCLKEIIADNIDGIYFLDSAIKPNDVRIFATALVNAKISIPWGTNLRFEKAFDDEDLILLMRKSGFVFAKFGLESGSQRVLNSMNKGTNVDIAANIVSKFRKHGIYVHTYVMVAYPGESQQDRIKTEAFLLSEYSHPDNYNCSEFILYGGASIANEYPHMLKSSDSCGDCWHSCEYDSFTDTDIQAFIKSMRRKFDHKYNPQSILMSTGHTIAYSHMFVKEIEESGSENYVALSDKVKYVNSKQNPYLLWWNRNHGCSYIIGEWATLLQAKLRVGISISEFDKFHIPHAINDCLWRDGCLCKTLSGNNTIEPLQLPKTELLIRQSERQNTLSWYGQFDVS